MLTAIRTEALPHPVARSYCFEIPPSADTPLFESGHHIYLVDSASNTFLDAISGIFAVSFGYSCEPIREAMIRQLHALPFSPPLHGLHKAPIRLCEELARIAPPGFDCVKLLNGGSESIEAALRIVRLYHLAKNNGRKFKLLSNYNGYNGATYGSITLTGRPDVSRFEPRMPGVLHVWPPDCVECPYGVRHPECDDLCASMIEKTIQVEDPNTIAAIVIEPVIHLLGMAVPPASYFRRLREICDRYEILLIFDEIVTGFGRSGSYFAAQAFGTTPDLMCIGKSISGGYAPLSAVLISERVSAVLRDPESGAASFAPTHTYAGNPVAAAAGLAAVELLNADGFLPTIRTRGEYLGDNLRQVVGAKGHVRGVGMLYGVRFGSNCPVEQAGLRVQQACMKRGLILRGAADWFVLAPAFVTSESELDQICRIVGESLDEVFQAAPS